MSEKYNQNCQNQTQPKIQSKLRVMAGQKQLISVQKWFFLVSISSTRHLSVQNALKADQRGIAHPWVKRCANWRGEQKPSLQKPVPTQTCTSHCLMGSSCAPHVCGVSPQVVTGPLCTQGRRFPLKRQRREMRRARSSRSPLSTLQLFDLHTAAGAG